MSTTTNPAARLIADRIGVTHESRQTRHTAIEVCQNADRSHNLFDRYAITDGQAEDGSELCADCCERFDDPTHGQFAHCGHPTAHVCRAKARPS